MSDETPAPVPAPAKAKRPPSRSARWAEAVAAALEAINEMSGQLDALDEAIANLRGIQEEYEEWQGNLPENLQSSALGDKLETIVGLDIESIADSVRSAIEDAQANIEEAEGAELPQGFGRD